jgi:hypothetical protein
MYLVTKRAQYPYYASAPISKTAENGVTRISLLYAARAPDMQGHTSTDQRMEHFEKFRRVS